MRWKKYDRHEKCTFGPAWDSVAPLPPTPTGIKLKLKSSKIETQPATIVIHSTEWILFSYVLFLCLHKSNHIEIQIVQFAFVHFLLNFSIAVSFIFRQMNELFSLIFRILFHKLNARTHGLHKDGQRACNYAFYDHRCRLDLIGTKNNFISILFIYAAVFDIENRFVTKILEARV